MYAVEFEAPIENGVVYIPEQYLELQKSKKARFIVMYDENNTKNDNEAKNQLEEFRRLRNKSKNKINVTMNLVTNIDEEIVNDGLF